MRLGDELYPRHVGNDTDEALDPYWRMDPLRAAGAATLIADRILTIRDGDWVMRALEVDRSLCALDDEIRDVLWQREPGPRYLVTSQLGLGYFAERYDCIITGSDLEPIEALGSSSVTRVPAMTDEWPSEGVSRVPESDPTNRGVSLMDPSAPGGLRAEMVTVFIDSLGEMGSEAATYEDMMRTNANRIARAGRVALVERTHTGA